MKMNVDDSYIQLEDLPDEILILILKNLNNADVLYSLINVNKRLNQIARDLTFTTHITLMKSSLSDTMVNRFCLQILPQVCNTIKCLSLETMTMERLLLAAEYPNLDQLDIFIVNQVIDINLFTGKIRE